MAEIVNLNRARKAKAKSEAIGNAVANRAKFGRTKTDRQSEATERARRDALLAGAKREDQ